MRDRMPGERPTVLVIGAGAGGTLTALHVVRTAMRRSTALDLVILDPTDRWGRGLAFGTPDDGHLLNVPAAGMSAYPERPSHFVQWRARTCPDQAEHPHAFVARRSFACYLDDTLRAELDAAADLVAVRHLRASASSIVRRPGAVSPVSVVTDGGERLHADAVVIATGLPPVGHGWADDALAASPFFVPDPWAPGALDVVRRDRRRTSAPHGLDGSVGPDVLVVGTGLTMVDAVLSLTRPGDEPPRRILAISRGGRLPQRHLATPQLPVIPDIVDWGDGLDEIVQHARDHIAAVRESSGDWRPAVDGLRFRLAELWGRLGEDDRTRFLREHAGAWGVLRHRMPPSSGARLDELRDTGQLEVAAAELLETTPTPHGTLLVTLSDGTRHEVGWVVNATGPSLDVRRGDDELVHDLFTLRTGRSLASVATGGMGVRTDQGRLLDSAGASDAPVWAVGALRRGELWESTAVPEIRLQASAVAAAVLEEVAPLPRRLEDGRLVGGHHPVARPRDPLGLPLSTTAEAAAAYNAGLERLMRLQSGAEDLLREAVELDPSFAVAHATLALLGHEGGATTDVAASVAAAHEAIERRGDAREASWVDVVARRVGDPRRGGAAALMSHIATHPRDAMAVSAAVPTIAFSGVTDVQQEAWDLVEGLAPAYGDHWWYISLLAFTRQDQGRFEEAGLLAESALSCEPASGHAVHAQSHVLYETGQHEIGRRWLDHWIEASGRSASHRAHFSWHAALHELALGDTEAVRRRYYSQLAPPLVQGVRALVDSASLLWRWDLTTASWDPAVAACGGAPAFAGEGTPPPLRPVLDAVGPELLAHPQTPFVALHAAMAHAAVGDEAALAALRALRRHCVGSQDVVLRTVLPPLCDALSDLALEHWREAAAGLRDVLPTLVAVGGSAAQRDILEEALIYASVRADDAAGAALLLDERLERRPSPLDSRRAGSVRAVGAAPLLV